MVQGNRSEKQAGAVVGLHYHLHQADYWYMLRGTARVVLHDLRVGSPTEAATLVLDLDGERDQGVFIPPGVAHGFASLTDMLLWYLVDNYYNANDELGVAWDDPDIGADWGLSTPVLSARDQSNPRRSAIDPAVQPHYGLRTSSPLTGERARAGLGAPQTGWTPPPRPGTLATWTNSSGWSSGGGCTEQREAGCDGAAQHTGQGLRGPVARPRDGEESGGRCNPLASQSQCRRPPASPGYWTSVEDVLARIGRPARRPRPEVQSTGTTRTEDDGSLLGMKLRRLSEARSRVGGAPGGRHARARALTPPSERVS